jgi:hypothetical protein
MWVDMVIGVSTTLFVNQEVAILLRAHSNSRFFPLLGRETSGLSHRLFEFD